MQANNRLSWFMKIVLLCCGVVVAMFVVSFVMLMAFGVDISGRNAQIATIVLQNVVVFILPVFLLAIINRNLEKRPIASTLWMEKGPSFGSIALVVIVYVAALPAMNYLVEWNQGLHLPQSLGGLEKTMRDLEDTAQSVTTQLLSAQSWGSMILLVLLVGVLTGVGEEMFFRSGILGSMFHGKVNRHVAVWTAAILFSAFHLQFYGFVPRMLLGAWFGYVMLWSGEVWTPIIAHALNNGLVVVFTFLASNHYIENNVLETLGLPEKGEFPWMALGSALLTVLLIIIFMRKKINVR